MLEIILSTIILISPGDSTRITFDVTIVFDTRKDLKPIIVYEKGYDHHYLRIIYEYGF